MATRFMAPPVQVILRAYPPAPARVGLLYRPLPLRALRVVLLLVVFWLPAPASLAIPPHYPFPIVLLGLGAWYAWRASRPYQVRWFTGSCPRCGRALELPRGTPIALPHAMSCCGCHFEGVLEVYDAAAEEQRASEGGHLRHLTGDCVGTWREETICGTAFLACPACGVRHHATAALRTAAAIEAQHGRLLEELAEEGRFLL